MNQEIPLQHIGSSANRSEEALLRGTDGLYFSTDNKNFLDFSSDIQHSSLFTKSKINKKVISMLLICFVQKDYYLLRLQQLQIAFE